MTVIWSFGSAEESWSRRVLTRLIGGINQPSIHSVKAVLAELEAKQQDTRSCQALTQLMGQEQFNTHESDARMMRTPTGARAAFNVQTAVDAEHCLILHHEVTQDGDDRKQLEPMAKAANVELG